MCFLDSAELPCSKVDVISMRHGFNKAEETLRDSCI